MAKQPRTKDNIPALDPDDVAEVAAFVIAEEELSEFLEDVKRNHPGVLETLAHLTERRNAVLEAAQKEVKARQAPCGPFEVHNVAMIYDAEALYNAVGEEAFLTLGGSKETKVELKIDGKRFDAAVTFKKLPAELIDQVRKRRVSFKEIAKIWVP